MASATTTVSAAAGADGAGAVVVGNAATPVSENDSTVRHRGRGGHHGGVRHSHAPEDFDKNPFINETAELKCVRHGGFHGPCTHITLVAHTHKLHNSDGIKSSSALSCLPLLWFA